ncbi:MAG: D-alanyl-D-alanine carboxypeptidase [Blastocatellia bacterium]
MKKAILILAAISLLLLLFLPFSGKFFGKKTKPANETVANADIDLAKLKPPKKLLSLESYLNRLSESGAPTQSQAVLMQTLEGKVLVEYNADTPLNPASVMKLAVSYLALKRFDPNHKFKTVAYTYGLIDESKQVLYGDLIIETQGDPNFTLADANNLAASIRSQGIKTVIGELVIKGPLLLRHTSNQTYVNTKLRSSLGLRFTKPTKSKETPKKDDSRILLGVHSSQSLKELLLYMNAHSDNYYAEHLGQILGGIEVIEKELESEFKLKEEELIITHASGLDYNRITPRASIKVFQKMVKLLRSYKMRIEDIMPVVGVDSGTLVTRLVESSLQGAVVAKTGTLHITDEGASILQGVLYTKEYGPVLFAIFNMVGKVNYFRNEQDTLLKELVTDLSLTPKTVRLENIFPDSEPILTEVKNFPSKKAYGRRNVGIKSKKRR